MADFPQFWWQVSFNRDPNDATGVSLWTDLTNTVRKVGPAKRGRQYELAQTVPSTPLITFRDPSEYLNPANTSSPYTGDIEPYREILGQAMWPNPPAAGQPNLLNSLRWKPNDAVAPDPSFESYANGAALPGWLTQINTATVTVTTTNPQQGTKCLTFAMPAGTARRGVSWDVDCVPGQQYTSSAYVRQDSASTLQLLVAGQTLGYDEFGRTESSGWGTATIGGAWSTSGGAAGDYSMTPGTAKHSVTSTNVQRTTTLNSLAAVDQSAAIRMVCPAVATGATMRQGLIVRRIDASNYYIATLIYNTDQTLSLNISRVVAGVTTSMVTSTLAFTYSAGSVFWMRFQIESDDLRARVWKDTEFEPSTWDATIVNAALSGAGGVGAHSMRDTGNTNGTQSFNFTNFTMMGATSSSTTTTTGSYVRLTNTFTATQPQHTVMIGQQGTGVSGNVWMDAFQHETGASASTFSTSGPVIYPWLRRYGERWTREYLSAGFEGIAPVPAVDAFAALQATTLLSDVTESILDLRPSYYWSLGGGAGTLQALEAGDGPPLERFDSKYGAGNPPEFGSALNIPGGAGGTGVNLEGMAPYAGDQPDSILSLGRVPGSPKISFPAAYTSNWSATVACWVLVPVNASDAAAFKAVIAPFAFTAPLSTSPLAIVLLDWQVQALIQSPTASFVTSVTGTGPYVNDGVPHLIVATVTSDAAADTTLSIYLDNALYDSATGSTTGFGGPLAQKADVLNVGGNSNGGQHFEGVIGHVAMWDRLLSADEMTSLWDAGQGHAGELSGARIERDLSTGHFSGARRISTGSSTMQAPSWTESVDLLADAQSITLAEQGNLWIAPDGAVVFEGRQERWLRLTSLKTFGEDFAGGEIPYGEGVAFDYDPTFVYANVRIQRNNGATAIGGTAAQIAATLRKYFGRSYGIGVDLETDDQAHYMADFIFATHRAPIQRVSRITIDPSSNPSLWPTAMSLEIGQRVTVKRRAKAANGGAGLTMSADYFIESVEPSELNMDNRRLTVSYLLSPIGSVGVGTGVSMQPWILEDTIYGVLDSTTILGW